ncbi:phosphopantetheine-binding protein [Roseomonas elaeocarpi]|uniref:Phosphopantetheine-binding protein n=1 Tax=Roseomonas elaeocarpi TaxID=907779 RepID=A0ABV6JW02_9PROT
MTDALPTSRDAMRREIAALLHEEPDVIGDSDDLADLGLDSMRAMTLLLRWNEAAPGLEFSEFAESLTLDHWWSLVEREIAARKAG